MAATTFHSVIIVFWKETAFPRWRAMDRRWKRNSVSLMSSVTTVMCLPISCVTSMAVSCHAPAISMANGQKMWVLANLVYLSVLLCAALWAAAPGVTAVLLTWFVIIIINAVDNNYYENFTKIRSGVLEPQGVKICPFPLLWPLAFTTACTTVQVLRFPRNREAQTNKKMDFVALTWMPSPPRRPAVTSTFDLQNLTRSSV